MYDERKLEPDNCSAVFPFARALVVAVVAVGGVMPNFRRGAPPEISVFAFELECTRETTGEC